MYGAALAFQEELAEVAKNLSSSPAEVGLIWIAGFNLEHYQNNFLPADLRNALGLKAADASAGRQALRNLNNSVLDHLYEAVVADGCAAPFATDRGPVLRSIEKAWQAKMPKRLQLDAAMQKRLSALGSTSRWHRLNHEELLGIAADPAKHASLQPREFEFKVTTQNNYASLQLGPKDKKDQNISSDTLRSIVQLVALIHGEQRRAMPRECRCRR